jgi:hypothetical protein
MDDASIKKLGYEINSRPIDDFDGLSPKQMHTMIYNPFSSDSVVQFNNNITTIEIAKIPIYKLVISLLLKVKNGDNKLTTRGNLSASLVKSLYGAGYISEYMIDSGITKLSREEASLTVNLTHLLCKISGYLRKRKDTLSITKKGFELFDNPKLLAQDLFFNHVFKFNLGYFDGYPETNAGAIDISYTLFLLDKYGTQERPVSFYSDKLITAFPDILLDFESDVIKDTKSDFERFMNVRIFNRFLYLYGFISGYKEIDGREKNVMIKKTEVFDQFFKVNYKP